MKPLINSSIFIPAAAIGIKPTGVKTEYLPPTSSGITKVLYLFSVDKVFKAPFLASVVAIILFEAPSFPYLFSAYSFKNLKAIAGSVVVPLFEITFI